MDAKQLNEIISYKNIGAWECVNCKYYAYMPSEVHCVGCARMYSDRFEPIEEIND